jgi:hypothetical protein
LQIALGVALEVNPRAVNIRMPDSILTMQTTAAVWDGRLAHRFRALTAR